MALGGIEKGTLPCIVWDVGDPELMKSLFSETPFGNTALLSIFFDLLSPFACAVMDENQDEDCSAACAVLMKKSRLTRPSG